MFKKITALNQVIRKRLSPVEYDLEPYKIILEEINRINMTALSDHRLQEIAQELQARACKGASSEGLLVQAFALVREASRRVLGLYPYDEQVMAGIALHRGKLVEMQTGEGKTLSAVMPAFLNALTGKGVHVLTFNDYLASRDAQWMGPIYKFLGMSTGFIREGMNSTARQEAYSAFITYVTAKEAGFDYLRDFLCQDKEALVHRPFHYAIVDEADSIFIDEARVPLVIAGNMPTPGVDLFLLDRIVRELTPGTEYELDQYENNVSLTEAGLKQVEDRLGCGNLYQLKNLELLARINCALHAQALLRRDKDYIVRDGRIEIIDKFTGRLAHKRHWPDNLQGAVAAKEGFSFESEGLIMGSLPLQYFLNLYPKVAGMTGTAHTSAAEFGEFYGLEVVVLPTHKPCIRKDHPDLIFTNREAKQKALVSEIARIHAAGQPILIGAGSVDESEELAADLTGVGIPCRILNAKNDEMEAQIIARAGEPGAVTVSTNMAGRGVDIKLGGPTEREKVRVAVLGGLYVIGTNRHESVRIDNQLRGRAGRQGDPGESRFFISLEDHIFTKYDFTKLITGLKYTPRQAEPIEDALIRHEVVRWQRIVEGYNYDLRSQLYKYSFIIEQQRRIIHNRREDILKDQVSYKLLAAKAPDRYSTLLSHVGEEVMRKVEKKLTLYFINKCWSDYLDYIAYIREGIHLTVIGKKNPLDEFHKLAIEAFDEMLVNIDTEIVLAFNNAEITNEGISMDKEGLVSPSSTWTYLINDSPEQFSNLPAVIRAATSILSRPVSMVRELYKLFTE